MRESPEKGKAEPTDGSRYFQGLLLRRSNKDIFIELPPGDVEPGMVGKLEKSLYGTRDAALNWAEAYMKVLIAMGYKKCLSSPCSSHHEGWDMSTVVHGDDFLTEGLANGLIKMNLTSELNFQVKTEIIGPDAW